MQTSDYRIGQADRCPYLQMFSQVSLPMTAIELTTLHVVVTEIGSTFAEIWLLYIFCAESSNSKWVKGQGAHVNEAACEGENVCEAFQ